VADLAGLSKAYISRLERGERCATPATKVEMARRLGAPISELFEVDSLPEPENKVLGAVG
jgi:transcriptional regulator with XRE-family HTH domain